MQRLDPQELRSRYRIAAGPLHLPIVEIVAFVSDDEDRIAIVIRERVDNEICIVMLHIEESGTYVGCGAYIVGHSQSEAETIAKRELQCVSASSQISTFNQKA